MKNKSNTISSQPVTALVASELSRFVFFQVTKGNWPYAEVNTHPLRELFSALQTRAYNAFIIDLSELAGDVGDIVELLSNLKDATGVPIILFASGFTTENPLVEELTARGFSQWVLSEALTTMYSQMEDCLNGAKNAIELAQQERLERKTLEKNVAPGHRTLGFVGTSGGVGTTTQAIQFVKHLQHLGYTASYVEAGNQRQMRKLPLRFSVQRLDKELGYLQYKGVDIYYKPVKVTPTMRLAYDICVFDYGVLTADNISLFLSCTGRACVAGSKAWEYGNLRWCLDILKKEDATFLVPFSYKKEHFEFGKLLNRDSLFFPMLNADMFSRIPANKEIYKKLCQSVYFDGKKKASVKQ